MLTTPTAESRAELVRTLSEALHGAPVTLADDALTRDGTLIIERTRAAHRRRRALERTGDRAVPSISDW